MDWYDVNGDGWLETGFGDTNADGYYDVMQVDANLDGYVDGYVNDTDFNGIYDTYTTDANQDGYADQIGWDTTGDGFIDSYASAETGWRASAFTTTEYAVIGPSDGTSTIDVLNNLPVDDLYTRIQLDRIIDSINWQSEIWTLPSPW